MKSRIAYACFLSIIGMVVLSMPSAAAVINIGPGVVLQGTMIEVVDPETDLVAIMNSISDASEQNPFLIKIGPGFFELSGKLLVKPYVHLLGAGPGVTILGGNFGGASISGASALVELASASSSDSDVAISIRYLSIVNNALGDFDSAVALGPVDDFHQIEYVNASATGGVSINVGVYLLNSSGTTSMISNTNAIATGDGVNNYGFYGSNVKGTIIASYGLASGDNATNYGISLKSFAETVVRDSRFLAQGDGGANRGFESISIASPRMENVEALATGIGSTNCGARVASISTLTSEGSIMKGIDSSGTGVSAGLCVDSSSRARIRRSTMEGSTASLDPVGSTSEFRITQSTLIPGSAGTTNGTGSYVCLYSDLFTPGSGSSGADMIEVLDTDCDNSN